MRTTFAILMAFLLSGTALAVPTSCSTWAEMKAALVAGQSVILTADIAQGEDSGIEIRDPVDATIDLNGHKITGCTVDYGYRSRMISIGWNSGAHITLDDTRGGGVIDGLGLIHSGTGGGFLSTDHATAAFTIKGGTVANFRTSANGGAIFASSGTLRVVGGMVTNCASLSKGGGIYTAGNFEMFGGSIVGCSSRTSGGGVCAEDCSVILEGGEIAYNRAPADANGLSLLGSTTFVMTGGRIHHNADLSDTTGSPAGGGGIYCGSKVTAMMSGGEICDNSTEGGGGGILFEGVKLTLSGGTIRGNEAVDGGGVAVLGSGPDASVFNMTGGSIVSNTCKATGGGIYGSIYANNRLNLSGGEISGNVSTWGGGIRSAGVLTMTGGVVSNNTAIQGSAIQADYSLGQKISGGIVGGTVLSTSPTGCLTIDGGLFDSVPGNIKEGYAATALPNVTPTTYLVGKNVGFTRGGLSSGTMGFNPSERIYKEAGVRMADGCQVTRSGTGYAIIAVRGTSLSGKVSEAIAFHGFLETADGKPFPQFAVVKIDFKLYPSANAGAELLWARRIPVTIGQEGGYYVDITDTAGQSYQTAGGIKPTCATLREALARHARISAGPLWIAYEPVAATVATPFPRVPLYFQPLAQCAAGVPAATAASVKSVRTTLLAAADTATVSADQLVVDTDIVDVKGLSFVLPHRDLTLNAKGGAVKLRNVTGLNCSAATNTLGALLADLPATADSDCGRVVKHVVGGAETQTALYYSKGDSTALPEGSTNVYVWSFGPLIQK